MNTKTFLRGCSVNTSIKRSANKVQRSTGRRREMMTHRKDMTRKFVNSSGKQKAPNTIDFLYYYHFLNCIKVVIDLAYRHLLLFFLNRSTTSGGLFQLLCRRSRNIRFQLLPLRFLIGNFRPFLTAGFFGGSGFCIATPSFCNMAPSSSK